MFSRCHFETLTNHLGIYLSERDGINTLRLNEADPLTMIIHSIKSSFLSIRGLAIPAMLR